MHHQSAASIYLSEWSSMYTFKLPLAKKPSPMSPHMPPLMKSRPEVTTGLRTFCLRRPGGDRGILWSDANQNLNFGLAKPFRLAIPPTLREPRRSGC